VADKAGLRLSVCHFPPGTSKWNEIEHRMFCFIPQNWRGEALISHEAIINPIASTTTKTGLTVLAEIDTYETGIKVTNDEVAQGNIRPTTSTANGTTPSHRGPGLLMIYLRSS
jgi:hypothetical protein